MAPLPTIHLIHASDAPQHLAILYEILQRLKVEIRIANYVPLRIGDDVPSLNAVRGGDMVLSLLTHELKAQKKEMDSKLNLLRSKIPNLKIAEIIVDHVPYGNESITFPDDLRPIRDRENMDAVWKSIERSLKDIFPVKKFQEPVPFPINWPNYLKLVGIFLGLLIAFFLLKTLLSDNTEQGKGNLINESITTIEPDGNGLNTDNGEIEVGAIGNNMDIIEGENSPPSNDPVPQVSRPPELIADFSINSSMCEAPCEIFFKNKSNNATNYLWDFGDGNESDDREPSHLYENPDNYTVTLTASGNGQRQIKTKSITITPAQTRVITGSVISANEPLSGVNVLVKGTTFGTVTDLDGKFTINVTNSQVLVFSFIGYRTKEIAVSNRSQLNVSLQEDF